MPPSKRNSDKYMPKTMENLSEELFPSLNGTIDNKSKESTMNFASSLFTPQPKEKIAKEVEDGWIHIFKENGEIEYKFGDNTENYIELMDWIEDKNEIKRYAALDKIYDRHMEYQEIDLMQNGPEYLECWEVTQYLEEKERERKRLQREERGSSDESSEGEYYD